MAPRPSLLLLDDPTTGLDPIVATTVDDEIVKLRDVERVTAVIVTHQIRDAFYVATHRAVRTDGALKIVPVEAARALQIGARANRHAIGHRPQVSRTFGHENFVGGRVPFPDAVVRRLQRSRVALLGKPRGACA